MKDGHSSLFPLGGAENEYAWLLVESGTTRSTKVAHGRGSYIRTLMGLAGGLAPMASVFALEYAHHVAEHEGLGTSALFIGGAVAAVKTVEAIYASIHASEIVEKKAEHDAAQERLVNGDIARAVGKAIAKILTDLANDHASGRGGTLTDAQRAALRAVAAGAGESWEELAKGGNDTFEALRDEGAISALTKARDVAAPARDPAFPPIGTPEMWADVLTKMFGAAKQAASLPATGPAFRSAAAACRESFAHEFYQELKHDFKHDGRAYAAVQLRMLGAIADAVKNNPALHERTRNQLDTVLERVNGHAARIMAAQDQTRRKIFRPMARVLISIDGKLDGALRTLERLETAVADTRTDVARLRRLLDTGPKLKSLTETHGSTSNMVYTARRVPMLAREGEMADLHNFLNADPIAQPVAWWVWYGAAGMGKSRLAFELCRAIDRSWEGKPSGWLAGFLDLARVTNPDWTMWEPKVPTLIVVDYASGKVEQIAHWIAHLARSAEEHARAHPATPRPPVRFLLLDRDASPQWVDRLRSAAGEPQFVVQSRYKDAGGATVEHHALAALPDAELPNVVKAAYEERTRRGDSPKNAASLPTPEAVAARYRSTNLSLRPLFVTLAAHAAFDGKNVTAMDEVELVRDWWKDELRQWAKLAGESSEATPRMKRLRTLLALATMAQGLPLDAGYTAFINGISDADLRAALPTPEAFADDRDLYRKLLSPDADASEGGLPPIEPDFFGEVFVLDHIEAYATDDRARRALLRAAATVRPAGVCEWLPLAARDFTDDARLHALLRDAMLDGPAAPLASVDPFARAWALGVCSDPFTASRQPALRESLLRRAARIVVEMPTSERAIPFVAFYLAVIQHNLGHLLRVFADLKVDQAEGGRTPEEMYRQAEAFYREAMAAESHYARSRSDLGAMLQEFASAGKDKAGGERTPADMYRQAEALYREAMATDPRHAISRYNLGMMLHMFAVAMMDKTGGGRTPGEMYRQAEALYREAMAADPRHADSRSNLGAILKVFADSGEDAFGNGREVKALYQEAEGLFREALAVAPRHAASLYNLGVMLKSFADAGEDKSGSGREVKALYQEAEELFRVAMAADPRHVESRFDLGVMLQTFASAGVDKAGLAREPQALYMEAETLYRAAMVVDGRHVNSRTNLSVILVGMVAMGFKSEDALAEAEALVNEALRLGPPTLLPLLVRATLMLARGEAQAGDAALGAVFESAKGLPPWLFGLLTVVLLFLHQLHPEEEAVLTLIKNFVTTGPARLPLLCLHRNAARAAADRHPDVEWLEKLAAVVEGRAEPSVLDAWPRWRSAK